MVNKNRLNQAFKALRKYGLVAKQNYQCCMGCACGAITEDAEKLVDQGKRVTGGVYYHKQAGDNLRAGKEFYVGFGVITSDKHGKLGTTDEEIGRLVVEEFTRAGLRVQWSGNVNTSILVQPGEPDPKTVWERLG